MHLLDDMAAKKFSMTRTWRCGSRSTIQILLAPLKQGGAIRNLMALAWLRKSDCQRYQDN
jgi:hypothetical protein